MLARKLTVILLVVVSLAATTFGILWTREALTALERRKIERLNTLAEASRVAVENMLKTGNLDDLRSMVERLEASREIGVFVLNGDGAPMIEPSRPVPALSEQTLEATRARSVWLTRPRQRVRVHPLMGADGTAIGKLVVTQDWADFVERRQLEALRIAEFVLALAMVTGAAVWLTVRYLVARPLERLGEVVEAISAGRMGPASRLPGTRGDEIGALGRALNDMQDALARAETELRTESATTIKLERSLQTAERHAAVGRVAAGLAHETGTALNVIQGRAELLLEGTNGDRATAADLGVIVQQCGRISRIIRGLLDYARPTTPHLEAVNLNALVHSVVDFLGPALRHVDVALRLSELMVPVRVDRRLIEDVIVNLVMNAAQAMTEGGVLEIHTESGARSPTGQPGRFATFRVSDSGPGIAPEHVDHIFEPFFSTKDTGQGTGLGLALSHKIVHDHGGEIDVDSGPGLGTTLRVYLPQMTPGEET
jgi:signal transduction histidine kinase